MIQKTHKSEQHDGLALEPTEEELRGALDEIAALVAGRPIERQVLDIIRKVKSS